MGVMIIDPEGTTVYEENDKREREEDGGDYVDPRLEEIVPDSDIIQREQEKEQIIISTIIGPPSPRI